MYATQATWGIIQEASSRFTERPLVVIRGTVFSGEVVEGGIRVGEFLGFVGTSASFIVLDSGPYALKPPVPRVVFRAVAGRPVRNVVVVEAGGRVEPISVGAGDG